MEEMGKKVKGFFERPEGTTGMIFIFIGVLAFLFAGNFIMPFIITALANTLTAIALGSVLLLIVYLAMNKKFRALLSAFFKSAMRWITGLFITIDPIGILKNYLDHMADKLRDIEGNIAKLNGQKQKLARDIQEKKNDADHCAKLASVAKKQGNAQGVALNMRKAARSADYVKKLEVIHEKMELLSRILMKMRNSVNFLMEDTEHQVQLMEAEYKSIKAAHKAMKGAEALVQGSEAKELFDQSCEFLAEDIANKLGEMETFMELSEDFMTNVDLQNGVWDEEGMKMLEQWENTGTLLGYEDNRPEPKVRIAQLTADPAVSDLSDLNSQPQPVQTQSQFASFFKKD